MNNIQEARYENLSERVSWIFWITFKVIVFFAALGGLLLSTVRYFAYLIRTVN